jgi:hypothetical protein
MSDVVRRKFWYFSDQVEVQNNTPLIGRFLAPKMEYVYKNKEQLLDEVEEFIKDIGIRNVRKLINDIGISDFWVQGEIMRLQGGGVVVEYNEKKSS